MLQQLSRNTVSLIFRHQFLADFQHLKTLPLFSLISNCRPPFLNLASSADKFSMRLISPTIHSKNNGCHFAGNCTCTYMYKFRHTVKYREGTDSDSTCMDPFLDEPNFRCRKCRIRLFCVNQLESHGDQNLKSYASSPTDLSIYDKCSSWFLRDDEMLPWITESVEKVW